MWTAARASEVSCNGEELSSASHAPDALHPMDPWIAAKVPGTVLAALIEAGLVPDPYIGLNSKDIPDIGEVGREAYTFWFCTKFDIDAAAFQRLAKQFWWLALEGVNYSFQLYLNGARIPVSQNKGMFLRRALDVTANVSEGTNYMAILVYPPDHPGKIPPQGGQGGDHQLAQDVVSQFFQGWDWIIGIPDRSTGIWSDVSLRRTGVVRMSDLYAAVVFSVQDLAAMRMAPAQPPRAVQLHVEVSIFNPADVDVQLVLILQIQHDAGCNREVSVIDLVADEEVTVPAGQRVDHTLEVQTLSKPELWWPVGMGKQPLYSIQVQACTKGATLHEEDEIETGFAVRHVTSRVDDKTGGRLFEVNGQRVFINGGNYIASDALLRQAPQRCVLGQRSPDDVPHATASHCQGPVHPPHVDAASKHGDLSLGVIRDRVHDEVRLLALANVNMLRCWGGAGCQKSAFYDACDEFGVLVWVEFWITGDDDGRGSGDSQYPLDHDLFMACAEDVVRAVRGHPSVVLYVGGNEQQPCQELNERLVALIHDLDPSRIYIRGSLWDGFADGHGGDGYLHLHDGPYDALQPRDCYKESFYAYGFNPEVGSVGVPVLETLRRVLPGDLSEPPKFSTDHATGFVVEDAGAAWRHHKYKEYGKASMHVPNQIAVYGVPVSLEDYAMKAQMANFQQYRALVEGYTSKMWRRHTGFLVWKIQGPWTQLLGQLYDCYLHANACLFGFKTAAAAVHAQLCPIGGGSVVAVNRTPFLCHAAVQLTAIALDGSCLASRQISATLPPSSASVVLPSLPPIESSPDQVFFINLSISAPSVTSLSSLMDSASFGDESGMDGGWTGENFYWVTKNGMDDSQPPSQTEFEALEQWRVTRPAKVEAAATGELLDHLAAPVAHHPAQVPLSSADVARSDAAAQDASYRITVTVSNPHPHTVALFVRLRLCLDNSSTRQAPASTQDQALIPSFMSDNFFSLMPAGSSGQAAGRPLPRSQSRSVTIDFRLPGGSQPDRAPPVQLWMNGFNVADRVIPINWS